MIKQAPIKVTVEYPPRTDVGRITAPIRQMLGALIANGSVRMIVKRKKSVRRTINMRPRQ